MKTAYSPKKFQEKHPLATAGLAISAWAIFLLWIHLLLYTGLKNPYLP
jgi:hypothetical protein